jgi:hypothetical protein
MATFSLAPGWYMLDATGKKLLRLLQPDQEADLRRAAARVLAEVGSRDANLWQALAAAVDDPDPAVRLEALAAVGRLRIEPALPRLLEKVREGGPEAEAAAQAAARLGTKGTRALQDLMGHVAPGLRRYIGAALAAAGSSGGAAVDPLLDSDPGVVDAAARSLLAELPSLPPKQRSALADHVLELLHPKKGPRLSLASEIALCRLLAALEDERGEDVLWVRVGPPHPPELRAAALQAVGRLPPPSKDKFKRLLDCAMDRDFRVAAPALMMLKALPVTDRTAREWLPLLDAPDVAARRFGMDKLAGRDLPEVAAALLRQLDHPDRGLRDEALKQLAGRQHGRELLAQALLEAANPDDAWNLARGQAALVAAYGSGLRSRLFKRACEYLEAGDRRAEPLLFLLREGDAHGLRDDLEERALALRKKKHYGQAAHYLRLLARDPACAEAVRFEGAGCQLKLSAHDLAVESRHADSALQAFARLVHNHDTDPALRIKQAKWLDPEDLFYLGFHFAEGDRAERAFGAAALRLVAERSPRSKLAKDARSKLRSAGLE